MKRKEAEQRAKEEAAGPNRRKRAQQWWESELADSKGGQEVLDQIRGDPEVCFDNDVPSSSIRYLILTHSMSHPHSIG